MDMSVSSVSRVLKILNDKGLHARPSAKIVQCASTFDAQVTVSRDGTSVSACSIMGLLMLAAHTGCEIVVEASGPDAENVLDAIESLVASGFGEGVASTAVH